MRTRAIAIGLAAVALLAACGDDSGGDASGGDASDGSGDAPVIDVDDGGGYSPEIDPANFVAEIDNPWFPLPVGATWSYEGTDDDETEVIEVRVLDETREVMGVTVTVVRDTVTVDGELAEDTSDWYAQDVDGNVWYFGEDTAEYEDGEVVSTHGSWEAGVDGALPGIVMQADPVAGTAYRQEYYAGEAEDLAEVVRVGESVEIGLGTFDEVVVTKEWNPFEPEVVEEKSYAPGIGVILEEKIAGGDSRIELVASSLV